MSDQITHTDPITALQRLTEPAVQGAMQSDAELLTLFVESGSRAAIETLIQRYAGMVASVCRCTVADTSSAEDAFQATFLVLLKSAKKIQNRRSLAAWLHGVAYRTACRLRKQRLANVSEQSPDEVIAPNQADQDPINVLARKLELEALDQELEKLPPGLREILVEHYLLGYSAPQISERTGLSVSAIEGRIRRGRYKLLRQLARRGISLTVLVAASTWFQQHLQAAEANQWTETFLDSYLPKDTSPADVDFTPNSDTISSLVRGEMNMFNASTLKTVYSAGATLLVGSLVTFNLIGDGDRPSAGTAKSDETGFQMKTLPTDETITVVAQLGSPEPRGANEVAAGAAAKADANANSTTSAQTTQTHTSPEVAASSGTATPKETPKPQPPREPIQWKVADGEPPKWLESDDEEQADNEMRELVRLKLRQTITVDFQGTPLRQALEEVSESTELPILLDTVELALAGIDPESPVSVKGQDISVREFLRRLFKSVENADAGMAYAVHEGSIEVTSKEAADQDPAIRYYDLAYVLPNDSNLPSVINAIEQSVSPDSWLSAGGSYTISNVGSMLIISCDEPSHHKIERMLSRIAAMNKANLEKAVPQNTPSGPGGMGGGMGGMGG
ncbi:MAG: RNA polymerase sigma factor, partial [Pirellulaceae bacterium]|nr:RNA polymerase sigma factor [Pirellulaceae bacterium]